MKSHATCSNWASSPALLLLVAACQSPAGPAAQGQEQTGPQQRDEAPLSLAVHTVATEPVATWTALTGTLVAEQRTQLTAGAAGRVEATRVERGQTVGQGEVLVTLDVRAAKHGAREAQANLRNIRAQRATSAADCRRYEALWQKKAISEQEHERMMAQCREVDAQFDAAEARAAEAARSLADGQVRAPYAGIVTERPVQVGDYVQPGSTILTLVKREPLRLKCAVPESQASFVAVGHDVSFEVAAFPGQRFAAKVRYVSGEVREQSRDIVFEAVTANAEKLLLPGMFATGRLYGSSKPLPVVPASALSHEGDHWYVFLLTQGRLEKHVVRPGEKLAAGTAIEEGLVAGDIVVREAKAGLQDGQAAKRED